MTEEHSKLVHSWLAAALLQQFYTNQIYLKEKWPFLQAYAPWNITDWSYRTYLYEAA